MRCRGSWGISNAHVARELHGNRRQNSTPTQDAAISVCMRCRIARIEPHQAGYIDRQIACRLVQTKTTGRERKTADRQNSAERRTTKRKEASLVYGTCRKWLWLLRSRPDQVDHATMRRGPPMSILPAMRKGRCRNCMSPAATRHHFQHDNNCRVMHRSFQRRRCAHRPPNNSQIPSSCQI